METELKVSLRRKAWLWTAAWGVAMIATATPYCDPGLVFWTWLFPVGLVGVFYAASPPVGGLTVTVAGWLLYVVLTIVGLRQNRRSRYFLIYAILCALLVLNVVGCHVQIQDLRRR